MVNKATLEIITNEQGQKKTKKIRYSTRDHEIVEVRYSINKGEKRQLGQIEYGPGDSPPPPVEDKSPVVSAGEDIDVLEGATVTLDGVVNDFDENDIEDTVWTAPDGIVLTPDEQDDTKATFTAPSLVSNADVLGLIFTFTAMDRAGHVATDSSIVTVRKTLEPPAHECGEQQHWDETLGRCVDDIVTPPPEPETALWSSNTHGKWNDGIKRTITTKQGGQTPNDKSIFVAASGNPKFVIDGDGVGHLVSGSGGVINLSIKGESRHQEGADCPNRGGGEGIGIAHNAWDIKREKCHNIHSSIDKGGLPKSLEDYKWYVARYTWRHEGSGIRLIAEMDYNDGKGFVKFADTVDKSPDAWFMDKALNMKNSYVWLRLNNSAHGRIYIMAINWDARFTVPFMFEPKENSIAFKDV
ncbi:MAG: PKD domain-containing protein, partial [Nitrososphaeraceae archaeon]